MVIISNLTYLLLNNVVSRYTMILIMNLSIFILHNVVSSLAQRVTKLIYFTLFLLKKNECLKNMSISH